jgi:sortase A
MRRFRGRLGTALIVLGLAALAYGAAVYFWRDPVTDLYARYRQHQLAGQLDKEFAQWQAQTAEPTSNDGDGTPTADEAEVHLAAERFAKGVEPGQALGRIVIPKIGIDPVFVNGTDWGSDLSKGPGRYEQTSLPGLGKVTAIAGHRTTFGAPFRRIDDLTPGDKVMLELPYGTFTYRVVEHEIVPNDDWSILEPRSYDTLVLSACHPLYSASERWIVYARLTEVELPNGQLFQPPAQAVAAG